MGVSRNPQGLLFIYLLSANAKEILNRMEKNRYQQKHKKLR